MIPDFYIQGLLYMHDSRSNQSSREFIASNKDEMCVCVCLRWHMMRLRYHVEVPYWDGAGSH